MIADDRQARRYVFAMGIATLVLLGSIPAVNIAVDPLGYARIAGWPSFPASPAEVSRAALGYWPVPNGTREAKILDVKYYRPESVVLGSSTVWSYVNVRNPVLREASGRSAFNFGIAGAGVREILAAYEHLVALHPPKLVVVGLEFYMFSADKPTYGFFDLPLAQRPSYRTDLARFVAQRLFTADYAYASQAQLWDPVLQRVRSVWAQLAGPQSRADAATAPPPAAPAERVGRDKFLESMLEGDRVIVTGLYPAPGQPFRLVDDEGWSSLGAIRRMVALARAHDIDLRLYLTPSHARSYEQIRLMGWWPQFEQWERGLTAIVDEDAKAHPDRKRIPLWDFGGYSTVTTGPVVDVPPDPAGFRFHADSHHFKGEVSVMFLDRMFQTDGAGKLPPDFGVLLAGDNIEEHLAEMTRGHQEYASANRDEVGAMARMLESLGRLKLP